MNNIFWGALLAILLPSTVSWAQPRTATAGDARKSLVLLNATTKMCEEWWLDSRGRFESSKLYCDFSKVLGKDTRWQLACQYKDNHRRVALQTLNEKAGVFELLEGKGESPGRLFSTLAACVRTKLR